MNIIAATRQPGAQLEALGHYQPERVLTNDELAQRVDTNDEWIRTRVGIRERRIAAPTETVVDMATAAAKNAIANAGRTASDVDLVIVATSTGERVMPNNAASVAARLGLRVGAFDINTACSGFCYALAQAHSAVVAGAAQRAIVIGAEKLSAWVDWDDRATSVLFGDGAGAAIVSGSETEAIGPVVWGSDGNRAELIKIANGFFHQEGPSVFRWASTAIAPIGLQACEAAGVKPADLAAVIPHQANARIVDAIAKRIGAENALVPHDVAVSGNTSAASVPLAFSKMVATGQIESGAPVLLLGFGAGLTYASQVVRAPR